ncbi:LacI family DNA-binding transcriptional regulator [Enterovirga rhinocerotis]|uniref:LacI family transcriptional regulator n=1 Tax=Enterovirga rhinocerotis TaxID=1339210 RepID=A0A4R7BWG4_9HYPH|nr:LacI family DNA-binding transcriptional regulator [Enterovirga rhinocerotis]TDR89015.1 LacI family transcriptional regulator [Enterovirga rhinocerotis]
MNRPRANLKDVAGRAGVDVSTASRVLANKPGQRVADETRQRILDAARDLDYRPNALARGLRTSRTFALGLVVPQLDNPVFSAAIRGAEMAAAALGYSLLISHRDPDRPMAGEYRRLAATHQVDGLLVASLDDDRNLIEELGETGVPFVLMNRHIDGMPGVALDSRQASRIAVEHLLDLGHRRVAHLAGRLGGFNGQARIAGYRDALEAAGIPFRPEFVEPAGYTVEGGADAMRRLLALPGPRPTGIVAATLVSATGGLAALHAAGIGVPDEVSVVAIHDAPIAAMVYPALTTIRMSTEEMGAKAAGLLVELIAGRSPEAPPLLPPEGLIRRQSTAKPAT